jgi:GlpG protein
MRLLYQSTNFAEAQKLFCYFYAHKIDTQVEVISPDDIHENCSLWVKDEDNFQRAAELYQKFLVDPSVLDDPEIPAMMDRFTEEESIKYPQHNREDWETRQSLDIRKKTRPVTLMILLTCVLVFFGMAFSVKFNTKASATIYSVMAFDYPKKMELRDELFALFTVEQLRNPQSLPREGKILLASQYTMPEWKGLYPLVVQKIQHLDQPLPDIPPMFEKIGQGQVWRLFTPCLLHGSILHLLFNMAWLLLLGNQMEFFLHRKKYLVFIVVSGILSNLLQYLMSGANFIGYSGVISAMLGYIYIRQNSSHYENYSIPPGTFRFVTIFIMGLAGIELLSFVYEIFYGSESFGLGIANTAHIGGALIGCGLAKISYFDHS